MNISKYILQLLYKYDKVTIPDIGAFTAKYQPAYINIENQVIYPPEEKLILMQILLRMMGCFLIILLKMKN